MQKLFLKSLFAGLLVLFFMTCLSACGDDSPNEPDKPKPTVPTPPDTPSTPEEPDQPQETLPVPGLSFTSINFANKGDNFACNIHGLKDGQWTAQSDQQWCTVSTTGNTLKISVMPNSADDKRSANISILHSDKRLLGEIVVNQSSVAENEALENSTDSKHSYLPIFSATWCPYSPDMDRTLVEIQKRWKYPILPMRIHVINSELNRPLSSELSDLYGNTATPAGYFENYIKVGNSIDNNVSVDLFWNLILSNTNNGSGYTDECSKIGCKVAMSDNIIEATISIEAVESGRYRLLAFILEDNIIKPQMSKTDGEILNYCHNAVLVGALTSVKGQEMVLTKSPKAVSLSGPTPQNVNLSNLRLLVVLERDATNLNYSDNCWFADNCISVPLGKSSGNGSIENIYIGEEIEN